MASDPNFAGDLGMSVPELVVPTPPTAMVPRTTPSVLSPAAPFFPTTSPGIEPFLPKPSLARDVITPAAIMALSAIVGRDRGGTGLLAGYNAGRQQLDRRNLQLAQIAMNDQRHREQQARLAAMERRQRDEFEQRRRQALGNAIADEQKQLRAFKTRPEFDTYLEEADRRLSSFYGVPRGTLKQQAPPFVPPPVRGRAKAQLDTIRGTWDKQVREGLYTPEQVRALERSVAFKFDIDADGQDETVTYRDLEDMAGEAMYDSSGKRMEPPAPRLQTYGEAFPSVAKGTRFENKPLPTKGGPRGYHQPDYDAASRFLRSNGLLATGPDRRRTTADRQKALRDDLEASIVWNRGGLDEIQKQMRAAGMDYDLEVSRLYKTLVREGRGLLTPAERDRFADNQDAYSPDKLMERAKAARRGGSVLTPAPVVPPVNVADVPPRTMSVAELRAVATSMGISEAEARKQAAARGIVVQ